LAWRSWIADYGNSLAEEIFSDLRGVPLEGFVIFYRVAGDLIEIMRIVSSKRDLGSLFSDVDDQ